MDGCRNTLDESYRHVVKYTVAFNEDMDKLNTKERLIFFGTTFFYSRNFEVYTMKNFDIGKIKKITNQGNLYYDFNEDIDNARNYAFTNCRKYNSDYQMKGEADRNLILDLLGSYGENFVFKSGFICEFGFNFHVGNNVLIGNNFKLIDCNKVSIGDNVQIENNVGIFTSKHAENPQYRADHWVKDLPITIGNNVIIEDDVVIGGGVTIGDNVVVERNSVVIKDVPSNSFVTGNPPCIKPPK